MTTAILVNVRSRHGSERMGARIRAILPDARVAVTHSLEDARAWIRGELSVDCPELLLSGGGDGTAVALLNELREQGVRVPALGLLSDLNADIVLTNTAGNIRDIFERGQLLSHFKDHI